MAVSADLSGRRAVLFSFSPFRSNRNTLRSGHEFHFPTCGSFSDCSDGGEPSLEVQEVRRAISTFCWGRHARTRARTTRRTAAGTLSDTSCHLIGQQLRKLLHRVDTLTNKDEGQRRKTRDASPAVAPYRSVARCRALPPRIFRRLFPYTPRLPQIEQGCHSRRTTLSSPPQSS